MNFCVLEIFSVRRKILSTLEYPWCKWFIIDLPFLCESMKLSFGEKPKNVLSRFFCYAQFRKNVFILEDPS